MKKAARIIYIIIGIVMPILTGVLHTFAHFKDLVKPEAKQLLSGELIILDDPTPIYNAWGLMSFMMGASFVVIGFLNFSIIRNMGKTDDLPLSGILAMCIYLLCVIYAGTVFNASTQLYGSIVGLIFLSICFFLTISSKENEIV